MQLKSRLFSAIGLAAALFAGGAGAATIDYGAFRLDYDSGTVFGSPSFSFSAGGGVTGFGWNVPTAVQVVSEGTPAEAVFELPSFTLSANPGWTLSGPLTSFLGNLVFSEFKGSTSASVSGVVMLDGNAMSINPSLTRTVTNSSGNFSTGYYATASSQPVGAFSSFSFSGGSLTLSATSGPNSFASITAQPQNELKVGLVANPVPEPASYALMLAGLAVLGALVQRRARKT
ncbi:PEP-CTERM sorting domain-containing protein [Paucibacter soli]|uniref:PEP-CTERM sorting domain-containing protein n=1 Tax=Paucibacter soli TaxID=3133433 RepID=UPI0030B43353